jgi:hypothetical protein
MYEMATIRSCGLASGLPTSGSDPDREARNRPEDLRPGSLTMFLLNERFPLSQLGGGAEEFRSARSKGQVRIAAVTPALQWQALYALTQRYRVRSL